MTLLQLPEACAFLNVSRRTLIRYINECNLPYIQVRKRGKLMFNKDRLIKWLERREQPTSANRLFKLRNIRKIK